MVKKFRRFYRSMPQSPVPSQQFKTPKIYDPTFQPDMTAFQQAPKARAPTSSIVRYVFDSRPPFAYDWFWEERRSIDVPDNVPYTVPTGYVLLLRHLTLSVNPGVGSNNHINPWGGNNRAFAFLPFLQILVNGAATPWFTQQSGPSATQGVPLVDLLQSDTDIDCFVLVEGGQTLTVSVSNISSFVLHTHYYGNMLLSQGRPVTQEVGNSEAEPVAIVSDARAAP